MGLIYERQEADVPILIVGGGPVGLGLALELGWLGVACMLVEQTDGSFADARLVNLNMRTMEFCRRWGIADEVRDRGFDANFPHDQIYVTSLTGHLLAHQRFPAFAELRTPPTVAERIARCPQTLFTAIQRRTAASFPSVALRYDTRCERVVEDETGITAELRGPDGRAMTVRAAYLACCEGANSQMRERLGIKLLGAGALSLSTNVVFRSEDLLRIHDKGPGFYTAVGPEGRWSNLMAVDGRSIWRLQIVGSIDPAAPVAIDPDEAIRRFAGRDFAYEIISVVHWTRRELIAERFRAGRVFLLGDAAHQLSPAGGFGGNTGIGDATNLAWKFAALDAGWGGPALVTSYELERRPIGWRNVMAATNRFRRDLETAGKPGAAILEPGPDGERVRRNVSERLSALLERTNCGYEYGARYEDAGLQLGYRYEDSPIIVSDGTPPPPDDMHVYHPLARPGGRAPHFWVGPNHSILDLFGRGFVLLNLADADTRPFETAAAAASMPLAVHRFDMPQLKALYNRALTLIRPDGHVAWRGDRAPDDAAAVIEAVRGLA
jgi:2-polyprenyl-6-methoxyphenol hydroxylase-like FAD-dependent oxidoreductase